jgi:hypothetical protein
MTPTTLTTINILPMAPHTPHIQFPDKKINGTTYRILGTMLQDLGRK